MEWFNQKNRLTALLLATIGLLLLYRIVVQPYLEWRDSFARQRDEKIHAIREARDVLSREKQLRQMLAGLGACITWDPSAAEGQLLHVTHAWEQSCGVTNASFQRVRTEEEKGYTQLTFQITAAGTMGSAATFLYCVETSPIPMHIGEIEIRPRSGGDDLVQISLRITTPCQGEVSPERSAQMTALAVTALATLDRGHE